MEIVRKILLMLICSFFALVLHPLFLIIGLDFYTESPFIVLYIVLTYIIVGTLIWSWVGKKVWWKQGVSIFVCINIVLAVILMCWINITIKDGMTGLMVLFGSFFDGCFSIIPIMLCSYLNNKYWEHNNQTWIKCKFQFIGTSFQGIRGWFIMENTSASWIINHRNLKESEVFSENFATFAVWRTFGGDSPAPQLLSRVARVEAERFFF